MTRAAFAQKLHQKMGENQNIYLITSDLGYGLWDKIRDDYSDRFFNVGSSEMATMGIGIGLAMDKKIPFVYSITPFALFRPYEMIRNYVNHESIPVNILGGGRDRDYGYLGFSHWGEDDINAMSNFKNIMLFKPNGEEFFESYFEICSKNIFPTYLNLIK